VLRKRDEPCPARSSSSRERLARARHQHRSRDRGADQSGSCRLAHATLESDGRPPSRLQGPRLSNYSDARRAVQAINNPWTAHAQFINLNNAPPNAWVGRMRVRQPLPSILNAGEVERLPSELGSLKLQAIVMAAHGAGLRVSEACRAIGR